VSPVRYKLHLYKTVGSYACEILRIPHCLEHGLTDGAKVLSHTHQKHLSAYSFLLEAEGLERLEELDELIIIIRSSDLEVAPLRLVA
jgi:hypothetical protein